MFAANRFKRPCRKLFLDALFGEHSAHHAIITLSTPWMVDHFYKEYCYDDDV